MTQVSIAIEGPSLSRLASTLLIIERQGRGTLVMARVGLPHLKKYLTTPTGYGMFFSSESSRLYQWRTLGIDLIYGTPIAPSRFRTSIGRSMKLKSMIGTLLAVAVFCSFRVLNCTQRSPLNQPSMSSIILKDSRMAPLWIME